ncbi:hypothetical protein [Variovorax sp. UC122_21]|uniref:hypothetical protein n=1 Tax=Variovorax sp. UC122_21 TaxID=3374554 RepID=UPI003757C7F6
MAGAIFQINGYWDVRIATDLSKMLAIDPSFKAQHLSNIKNFLETLSSAQTTFAGLDSALKGMRTAIELSGQPQAFSFIDDANYQSQVAEIMRESVDVARARIKRRPKNRVRRNLRSRFQAVNLWSKKDKDIASHKVVEGFLLSAEHGITAEFALRNTVMHITETVDFELHTLSAKRVEAQAKTLVLDEAEKVYGSGTRRYVVVAGSQQPEIQPSLRLLEDRAQIFALESSADMDSYMKIMLTAAANRPLLPPLPLPPRLLP